MKLSINLACLTLACAASTAAAQHAVQVLSYTPGAEPSPGYTNPLAALGEPQRDTQFGEVTPFNPPFSTDDLTSIGEEGEITLRLSNYAVPQAGAPEIGVFVNTGFIDVDYPNGQAGTGAGFGAFGVDSATVEVSADGLGWVALGDFTFDNPTAGYTDAAFTNPSDFQLPFIGAYGDFEGLTLDGMLTLLGGSGGGLWLDISSTGLSEVGYVRFSLADDLDGSTDLNFDLDAVSISRAALGAATVPEPASLALLLLSSVAFTTRRHVQPRGA